MATTGSFYDLSEVDIDVSMMATREVCHAGTLRAMCLPLLLHLQGKQVSFDKYKGKTVLALNVASKCAKLPRYVCTCIQVKRECGWNEHADEGLLPRITKKCENSATVTVTSSPSSFSRATPLVPR
jgi:hypothetical protein